MGHREKGNYLKKTNKKVKTGLVIPYKKHYHV